jgi:hypothetical protein
MLSLKQPSASSRRRSILRPELDDHNFLNQRQHLALETARWDLCIGGGGSAAPLGDGRTGQALVLDEVAECLFRLIELRAIPRRCTAAAVNNICDSASFDPQVRIVSCLSGTEHDGRLKETYGMVAAERGAGTA